MSESPARVTSAFPREPIQKVGVKSSPGLARKRCGVLLVGHGTRDQTGTAQFFQLADELVQVLRPLPVAASLLEFQQPTIAEGWQQLVDAGVQHIHVAPLLLFAAGHAREDIPREVARCQQASRRVQASADAVTVDQSRPLSRHPALVDLVAERLKAAQSRLAPHHRRVGIVMVGRGNRDVCAQADMRVLTEVISRRVPHHVIDTAFYAMAEPKLPAVMQKMAEQGEVDAVIVFPHLLFEGRLYQAIQRQVQQAAEEFPSVEWITAQYLGPERRVAQAIADRVAQAQAY